MAPRLLLLRHGQITANRVGRWHGSTDSPLTLRGRWQAWRTGRYLSKNETFAAVYTSPLQRCRHTAALTAPASKASHTVVNGLAEMSIREQAGLLAYSPLACGYLSGKYRNKQIPKNSRIERDGNFWTRYQKPNMSKAVDSYFEISKKHNLDMSQMCLKFIEIQPFVTSVIIGATTMEQLKTNIESVNVNLTDEIIKEINEVQIIYPNPCP